MHFHPWWWPEENVSLGQPFFFLINQFSQTRGFSRELENFGKGVSFAASTIRHMFRKRVQKKLISEHMYYNGSIFQDERRDFHLAASQSLQIPHLPYARTSNTH
jgi:hypothetical protein